jgi:hypothetical protein
MRQHLVHQQGNTVGHSSGPATGAKTAAFATERHQFLMVTGLTANPQEAMLKPTAFEVLIKFALTMLSRGLFSTTFLLS